MLPAVPDNLFVRIVAPALVAVIPGLGWLVRRSLHNATRLARLEAIVDELAESHRVQVDILPRLEETLRNLVEVCRTIVPRPEWENVQRLNEQRMDRLGREK